MNDPIEHLDFEIETPVVSFGTLDDFTLKVRLDETVEELLQRGEAINPKTQTGRDLHSIRTAILVEMAKRGMR